MSQIDFSPIKPVPVKRGEPLEKEVERYLRNRIMEIGGECVKFGVDNTRGVPDRFCVFPGGEVWLVEVKRNQSSKLTKRQERFFTRMEEIGFGNMAVVHGKAGVDEWLEEVGY